MPVRSFDDWSAPRAQTYPLSTLKNAVLGIEASHYIRGLLTSPASKEPLLPALGGVPFALKTHIENDLDTLAKAGVIPLFVFNGMSIAKKEKQAGGATEKETIVNVKAWDLYDQGQAVQAVETFGNSRSIKPEDLYRYVQKVLREKNVNFLVAPYSAWGQLSYLENDSKQFVDAIVGSSELFLFDVDKVITKIDFEKSQFSWLSKRVCRDELGKISNEMFVDACMLSGSSFLSTFPPLENPQFYRKSFTIRDSINLMNTLGRNVTGVCTHYQDDPQVQQSDYLDRYRRGSMAVKHHVILTDDGKVEPLNLERAPSDIHEFIGQRLPEELYFYLSRGVIGPQVLDWLTSGQLMENPPLDNGDSEEYRSLVRDKLANIRTQALSLLAQHLARFYANKNVTVRFWFDNNLSRTLTHKGLVPPPFGLIADWNVHEDVFTGRSKAVPGTLSFAIRSLDDIEFAAKTVTKTDPTKLLTTKSEILANTLWRFLHVRGYVDEHHNLTSWGKVLNSAVSALNPEDELEEAVFLAVELLRLNLLNSDTMFPSYSGQPLRGSDQDKKNCLIISRVATLGKLRHQPIGFTGPLSRSLLGYHSIVSVLRANLRGLLEMVLASLLLHNEADRENRSDWTDLGLELPLLVDNDCGLAIAVKSYLDELPTHEDPTSGAAIKDSKAKGKAEWFPYSVDFEGDLGKAFRLWDAVVVGVKTAGKAVNVGDRVVEADKWLTPRR